MLRYHMSLIQFFFLFRPDGVPVSRKRSHGPFFQIIILSMQLLPRMNAMLDFICMGPVDLLGACRKRQNTK